MTITNEKNYKKHFSISDILKMLAIALLIGYMFFMKEDNKIITYMYFVLEFIAIIILLMYNDWKLRINNYIMFIIALVGYIFLLTWVEKAISYSYFCMVVGEVFLTIFVVNAIKNNPNKLVYLFEGALLILFVFDIVSVIVCLFTGKHTNDNFGLVGHKNYHSFLFILTIGFKLLNNKINKKRILDYKVFIIALISIITEFVVESASGAVAVVLLVFLCYLLSRKKLPFINLTNIFIGLLVISYILIFGMSYTKWLNNIFTLLGRDGGLTGRAAIWTETLKLIKHRYLFGYGYYKQVYLYFPGLGWAYNHCHNFFLNLVLSGGFVYALIIMAFMFIVAKRTKELRGETINILTYLIGCYFLLGISEIVVNVNTMFFPLLTFGFYSKYFSIEQKIC